LKGEVGERKAFHEQVNKRIKRFDNSAGRTHLFDSSGVRDGLGQNKDANYITTNIKPVIKLDKGTRKSIENESRIWHASNKPEVGNKQVRDVVPKELRKGKAPGFNNPFASQLLKLA